jgi:hypothetical protein
VFELAVFADDIARGNGSEGLPGHPPADGVRESLRGLRRLLERIR